MGDITLCTKALKDYYRSLISSNIEVSGKFFNAKKMQHFPLLLDEWNSSLTRNEFVYDIIFDITEKPKCKICGNTNKLKNFKEGYRSYCSNKCVNIANSQSEAFADKISESRKVKFNEDYYMEKYKFVKEKDGENFLISGYCVHNDFWINKNRFMKIIANDGELCESCIDEMWPDENNLSLYENKYSNEKGFKCTSPLAWKSLTDNCKEIDAEFSEKRFMFKTGLRERPVCPICAIRKRKYISVYSGYTQTCVNDECVKSSSIPEQEIFKIVKSIYPDAVSRYKIEKEEIDIFIPSINVGIEFNGLYWHSEKFRKYRWHLDKMQKLRGLGIKMFNVWEDDWRKKSDIVLSQILNICKKSTKIHARKTKIVELTKKQADIFIEANHIQGACNSSYRYGLLYNEILVSVMTFGKQRMIFHSNDECEYELLRFCSLKNNVIIGGGSKLFSNFIKVMNPATITSYANYDISNGDVYYALGFKLIDKIYPGYWWCKDGEKFHRSNFMKHKIAISDDDKQKTAPQIMRERGYYRVWNSGNLKFIWNRFIQR